MLDRVGFFAVILPGSRDRARFKLIDERDDAVLFALINVPKHTCRVRDLKYDQLRYYLFKILFLRLIVATIVVSCEVFHETNPDACILAHHILPRGMIGSCRHNVVCPSVRLSVCDEVHCG